MHGAPINIFPQRGKGAQHRALDHPNLGLKFSPIPNAKKYGFFPLIQQKIPKLIFFGSLYFI